MKEPSGIERDVSRPDAADCPPFVRRRNDAARISVEDGPVDGGVVARIKQPRARREFDFLGFSGVILSLFSIFEWFLRGRRLFSALVAVRFRRIFQRFRGIIAGEMYHRENLRNLVHWDRMLRASSARSAQQRARKFPMNAERFAVW